MPGRMLDFLVTSKARRRLLTLMIGDGVSGSAGDLARRARVGFASAHRELQAMRARGLVTSAREGRVEVYRANHDHPAAVALRALVVAPVARDEAADTRTRSELLSLGAPLYGTPAHVDVVEEALVRGVARAQRTSSRARIARPDRATWPSATRRGSRGSGACE